jgi:DNA-binding beta-propeller fold protein YncE
MEAFGRGRSMVRGGGLAAAVVLLSVFCATAQAGVVHPYLGSFGPDGATGTAFGRPGAVAVDQADGDVYVADTAAGTISKFGADGEPVEFGTTGSNKLEGLAFSDAEPGLVELAVSPTTHDVYAVENAPVNGVSVFHADGEPAEFTALGSHILTGFTELCGVAIDSEGDVYAADYEGGVSVFDPSGTLLTTVATSHVCGIAVGPGGDLYANQYQGGIERLAPSSYPVTGATTYGAGTIVDPTISFGVAVDPTGGDLYADERDGIAQYDATGDLVGRSGADGEGALGESEGVAVEGSTGNLFATAPQLEGNSSERIARYGPGETEQPRVEASWAGPVGDVEATLNAAIDPLGINSRYHFEYGLGVCASGGCTVSADAALGAGSETLRVSLALTPLQPNTEYHFRVVVTTAAGSRPGPERTFRTYAATSGAGSLADGRGYELVSAGPDNSAELGVPGASGGLISGGVKPQRAAADGEAFAFPSWTAFGDATAAPNSSSYLARRLPSGWSTMNITVRDETRGSVGPIRGFSPDLGTTAIVANSALAPGAVPGYPNLYLRDNATGALTALTTATPAFAAPDEFCVNYVGASEDGRQIVFTASGGLTPEAPAPEQSGDPNLYEWSAADGVRLVSILPDGTPAPTGAQLGFGPGDDSCLIDLTEVTRNPISADGARVFWSETRGLRRLFARLDGTRTVELDAAQGGAGPNGGGTFLTASTNGSRVFFSDPNPLVPGASQGAHFGTGGDLYEFDFATGELTDLTAPAGGEPSEVLGLVGASEDGSYVYFVAEGALRPGATAGGANLYLDHDGSLSLIARLSSSEDSKDWISLREQTATVSSDGKHLAFVSTEPLTGYDNELAGGGPCRLGIEGHPEGSADCDEVYLFDVEGDRLSCASCNPTGANPIGPIKSTTGTKASQLSVVPGWATPFEQPRYLSADGSRLFFLSEEGLVPTDTNGEQDVYEFERPGGVAGDDCSTASPTYVPRSAGCLSLISSGRSAAGSYLLDASADGEDVFISTNQALTSGDEDGSYDIYDARVGGSSSPPAPRAVPCSAEGCRTVSAPAAASGSVGTIGEGGGNLRTPVCPKGRVRRGGRCHAKHRPHRHGRKHGHRKAPRKKKKRGGKR